MIDYKANIKDFDFNDDTPKKLEEDNFYADWPVVYILNNDKEMYIGETYHSAERMRQHLKKEERRKLDKLHVIESSSFTKSATLDIESSLIELCKINNKRKLQNANDGIVNHHFANKDQFRKDSKFFYNLWKQLDARKLVTGDIENIINSDLFKYSPFKSLNSEQSTARDYILEDIENALKNNKDMSIFVDGSAGTGKTILAIYIMKLLVTNEKLILDNEDDKYVHPFVITLNNIKKLNPNLKVAYVVSMTSLRKTLKKVFKGVKGLSSKMVIKPSEVFKDDYDILIVDEAHRLMKRKNITGYGEFDKNNKKLGLGKEGTQLDWITNRSKIQIMFYDSDQSIKPTDVDQVRFEELQNKVGNSRHTLSSQMRCMAGSDYIKYVKNILNCSQDKYIDFKDKYDFRLFDDINAFTNAIYEKEMSEGLSRIVAGYGFKWNNAKITKKLYKASKPPKEISPEEVRDVAVDGKAFYWNRVSDGWVLSIDKQRVKEEVGCIHTIQGYDLNYCGVIFGPEIVYRNNHIEIIKSKYYDAKGKADTNDAELKNYILNIYSVLLTRGINGTYVYVCDKQLREYLRKFINTYNEH